MKSLLVIFLSIFLSCQINLQAVQPNHPLMQTGRINCAKEIQEDLLAIYRVPEGKVLIDTILNEGSLKIIVKKTSVSEQFGAYWDPDTRTICLAVAAKQNECITGALLFELHNALVTSKIDQLDDLASKRQLNRASYVESMEYLEYVNSLNASKIAEKGIQMGILDQEARLPTYPSFKEHFHMQKISGHSAHFSRNYDRLAQRYL
ncbi:MAG: hypothetical protein H0V82_10155 [Candidatus Protochlamydia sp.]|nr:hypothetical protein [Candidatus Protochlamydia sp.]